jgi:signal peptidase II
LRLAATVCGLVVAADAGSKALVAHLLVAGRVVHVAPGLRFDLYYNHAGAGNTLSGRAELVTVLSILAVLTIAAVTARASSRGNALGLGLLLGGGIGNLLDRLFGAPGPLKGGVIDWIRLLGSSGSMNLADLAINLGLVALAITAVRAWWTGPRRTPRRSSAMAAASGAGADPA